MASHGWNVDVPTALYCGPIPHAHKWAHLVPTISIDNLAREIYAAPEVAIDTETTGLVTWRDYPLYFSLAWGQKRATVHATCLEYFKESFADIRKRWILANAKYDGHMLANRGALLMGPWVDTQVEHALLYEEQPHGLKDMAKTLLGWKWSDFQDTFGKITKNFTPQMLIEKAELENFPLLVEYAANDAWGTLNVHWELKRQLKSAITHSLFRTMPLYGSQGYIETLDDYFEKIERPYSKVLWKNERNGILVNMPYLQECKPVAEAEIARVDKEITQLAGWLVNPRSTPDLRKLFITELGINPVKMTSGGKSGVRMPSVDENFLKHVSELDITGYEANAAQLRKGRDIAQKLLTHRSYSKLYGTYLVGLSEVADPYGRIHTRFNQDVARCMPAGELVLTSRGYLPVEAVQIGDRVITHRGRKRKVTHRSKHRASPIYAVRLKNGLVLRTNGKHPYFTKDGWRDASELHPGDAVYVHSHAEIWATITGWPYTVSSWGRVRSTTTGRVMALHYKNKWGHLKVTLVNPKTGHRKDFGVHQLVLTAFQGDAPSPQHEVRHLNGIGWDNTLTNLSYGTSKENTEDARRHGTLNGAPKLTKDQVEEIRRVTRRGQPESTTAKLTFENAEHIRERFAAGEGRAELAREFEVSYQAVDAIVKDRTWVRPKEGDSAEELGARYGVSAAAIRDIWAGRRWDRDLHVEPIAGFWLEEVDSIEIQAPDVTYGLTVEEDESHVTGGVVTHNTGRLSSADPNLQNIPTPENDKWNIRNAFIAQPGHDLIVADYEQLEMRLLACASLEQDMISIFLKGWDIHMGNAALVFGIPYDEIKAAKDVEKKVKQGKLPPEAMTVRVHECLAARQAAKAIGFGLNYGMGPNKLAVSLNCSAGEAQNKIDQYFATYPAVRQFYGAAIAEARKTGYAYTIAGRRRAVPEILSSRPGERNRAERVAVNLEIQGTAADVVKMAQIQLDKEQLDVRYGCRSILQVHDELVHEVPKEYTEICKREIRETMEHPFFVDLAVPLSASVGSGFSWAQAK